MSSTIRTRLLKNNLFSEKTISIRVPAEADVPGEPPGPREDLAVLLRQPTVGQRSEIMAQMKVGRDGDVRSGDGLSKGLGLAIIFCALEPVTRKPIFDLADLDSLVGQPAGSWFDEVAAEAMGLMSEAADAAKK